MGSLIGHVGPGLGFFIIGFWHLYNHLKLLAMSGPHNYTSSIWFPFPWTPLRHLELLLIMLGCAASISMELFIGPHNHQPLDPDDGTIPSNHLHNFEHSFISLSFFLYSAFALLLRRRRTPSKDDVVQLLCAMAFSQELLLFHLHSADHKGLEGQYHWLLQLVIFVSLSTTLIGIGSPKSFVVGFVRSLSVLFQGVWLVVMGFGLWSPGMVPKGCFLTAEEGHQVVRCGGEESLHRAKALVNILFSWFLILLAVFAASFYMFMISVYYNNNNKKVEYVSLIEEDVEAHKIDAKLSETQSIVTGDYCKAIDHMER